MPDVTELRLSELQLADGASYDPTALMGGAYAQFQNMFVPPLGEAGANGDHAQQFLDMWWGMAQLMGNACQLRVCREASDSDVQFSVTPGKVHVGGTLLSFAGGVNYGPLTAGSLNYIYATFADPTVLVPASSTTGFPTQTPHLKLATIDQPASGPWRAENLVRHLGSHAAELAGMGRVFTTPEVSFNYNTSSPVPLFTLPANVRIVEAFINVDTTFNGSFAGSIGDSGSNSRHLATGDVTWGSLGGYTKRNHYKYGSATLVNLYLTQGGASQGVGKANFSWRFV